MMETLKKPRLLFAATALAVGSVTMGAACTETEPVEGTVVDKSKEAGYFDEGEVCVAVSETQKICVPTKDYVPPKYFLTVESCPAGQDPLRFDCEQFDIEVDKKLWKQAAYADLYSEEDGLTDVLR